MSEVIEITLEEIELDEGGYDEGGRYFGIGERLWSAHLEGEDRESWLMLRDSSKDEALRRVEAVAAESLRRPFADMSALERSA